MASLSNAGNVSNTCLLILRKRGYELWTEGDSENANPFTDIFWFAKKGGYDFVANSPLELLGLVAIFEFKNPQNPPEDYWWLVEGENILDELLPKTFGKI